MRDGRPLRCVSVVLSGFQSSKGSVRTAVHMCPHARGESEYQLNGAYPKVAFYAGIQLSAAFDARRHPFTE
ncbi:hypothetical protein FHU36_001484 [Nonomuraea muscovyensis]|uniref:Uncharacterized protein n=1 Tax=Nonomuraea muscovyensis TaxID=1124761 RepID=A0A7X0EXN3_9ACTN|nr:hypothetical protein [Nonomuraea muscovyensis]